MFRNTANENTFENPIVQRSEVWKASGPLHYQLIRAGIRSVCEHEPPDDCKRLHLILCEKLRTLDYR